MKAIVVYGSDSGAAEAVAESIAEKLGADCEDAAKVSPASLADYDLVVFGSSTQGVGDLQDDWESLKGKMSDVDLSGKKAAVFGLGDGVGYADSFVDAMAELAELAKDKGAEVVGAWSSEGYDFSDSAALDGDNFVGLAIDEDNQSDLTEERVDQWVEQVKGEL